MTQKRGDVDQLRALRRPLDGPGLLEAVFGLLFGILFLGETVTFRAAAGCLLILASVILAELEPLLKKNK